MPSSIELKRMTATFRLHCPIAFAESAVLVPIDTARAIHNVRTDMRLKRIPNLEHALGKYGAVRDIMRILGDTNAMETAASLLP